jgi:hypothetical protein
MSFGYQPVPVPETDQKAIWALVSSIAGFFLCPVVLHIVGWVLANQSLETIRASQGRLSGDGLAKAARILAIIGLVISALTAILVVILVAGVFAASN